MASGGASAGSRARNPSTAAPGPSTSSSTPRSSLQDPAAEPELGREPEDVRAEADALDRALDADPDPLALTQSRSASISSRSTW